LFPTCFPLVSHLFPTCFPLVSHLSHTCHTCLRKDKRDTKKLPRDRLASMEESCVICTGPLTEDVYELQCCGKKAVHESCMNQHAHYVRKEYFKQHQNLEGLHIFCMLCKQDSRYTITKGPSVSIPSTLPSSTSIDTPSGFTSLINAGSDSGDPSYEPEVPLNDHEVHTIADSQVPGQIYCACCFKLIDPFDDKVSLNCCGKLMHESCQSVTTTILQKLDMNKSYRGASCIVCASSRYMISTEYTMIAQAFVFGMKPDKAMHPLTASPSAHYLITRCVLYLYGYNFQDTNPWSLKLLFEREPDLLTELDKAKVFFVESPNDMELLQNISTTTVHKHRNVFLDPDRALDIFGRIPNCESIMFVLYKIHRNARLMYPDIYDALLGFHTEIVERIENVTRNTIVHPPKHTCMKPCSRTMCVEAHPIIRVPTVGSLPTSSAPQYSSLGFRHLGVGSSRRPFPSSVADVARIDITAVNTTAVVTAPEAGRFVTSVAQDGVASCIVAPWPVAATAIQTTPPRAHSDIQGSCVNPMSPGETDSPIRDTIVSKSQFLMCILSQSEFTWLSTLVKTLKALGKMDENSKEDQQTLLNVIISTDDIEDLQFLYKAFCACGGNPKRKRG
jgi:hypothetical protein